MVLVCDEPNSHVMISNVKIDHELLADAVHVSDSSPRLSKNDSSKRLLQGALSRDRRIESRADKIESIPLKCLRSRKEGFSHIKYESIRDLDEAGMSNLGQVLGDDLLLEQALERKSMMIQCNFPT